MIVAIAGGTFILSIWIVSGMGANFIPEPRFQRRLDKLMKVEETGPP